MTDRVHINSDRLLVSAPGYSASDPGLDNKNVLIDSRWSFSAFWLYAGSIVISVGGTQTAYFPDVGGVPFAQVFLGGNPPAGSRFTIELTSSSITIDDSSAPFPGSLTFKYYIFAMPGI